MSKKLDNAKGLYLEGIQQGHAKEALDKYIGDRYTQHSTGVADGKEGFLEFFLPFLKRNPVRDIKIVRAIEDGQYVFVHAHQSLNNGEYYYVTGDIFDTDANDKIIEHWDAIQEENRNTVSGHSMTGGTTEVVDLDKTEENRAFITEFANEVLLKKKYERIHEFISTEKYIQHDPLAEDGLDGLIKYLDELFINGGNFYYKEIHKILVQGNFTVLMSKTLYGNDDYIFIDIFRIEDKKIVEHWDVIEKILPEEMWNNSGKF